MVATLLCFSVNVHAFKDAENCVQGYDFVSTLLKQHVFIQSIMGMRILRRNCGCESVVVWGKL